MKTKIQFETIKGYLKTFYQKTTNYLMVSLGLAIAFFIGYFYQDLEKMILNKKHNFGETRTQESTSISVTDRGELMIIDREEQKIQVFNDTVGIMIFNAYSNRIVK